MIFAGNVAVPCTRETVIILSSSGWRRLSIICLGNSGNSSAKKIPLCASDISPGLGVLPPPIIDAVLLVWWGDRNGRVVMRSVFGGSSPDAE